MVVMKRSNYLGMHLLHINNEIGFQNMHISCTDDDGKNYTLIKNNLFNTFKQI